MTTTTRAALLLVAALGCAGDRKRTDTAPGAVSLPREFRGGDEPTGFEVPPGAYVSERDRCIDRELARRQLNAYGDPQGTTYPEGAPLELRSGADRYDYVVRKHRGIGAACSRAPGEPVR